TVWSSGAAKLSTLRAQKQLSLEGLSIGLSADVAAVEPRPSTAATARAREILMFRPSEAKPRLQQPTGRAPGFLGRALGGAAGEARGVDDRRDRGRQGRGRGQRQRRDVLGEQR